MMNWKILIVTNNKIIDQFYEHDRSFSNSNWSFFNVSNCDRLNHTSYDVINAIDIPNYEFLGKDWAESEVIYNVAKLELFKEYDWLGIVHWDFNLLGTFQQNGFYHNTFDVTQTISQLVDKHDVMSFFPATLQHVSGIYDVMMDERKPNCLFCRDSGLQDPKSCNEWLMQFLPVQDIDLKAIDMRTIVPLCCSFLCKRDKFIQLGNAIAKVKESKQLEKFDTEHRHRYPGQVMERLVALYLSAMFNDIYCFRLDHKFIGGQEINMNDANGENY